MSASELSTFVDFTPYERQVFIAELYHNAWYSQDRFELLYDLFKNWQDNPIKEKKFINESNDRIV